MRLRKIYIFIAMVFAGLAVQALLASPVSAAPYVPQGIATSTNLLSGSSAASITNFHYNIATLPATSSVRIQFSKDNTNWYSSGGTPGGWDTLALGQADLSLTAFVAASSWTNGNPFYYKLEINSTADLTQTPTIDDIRLDYTPTSGYENVFVFDNFGNVGIGTTSPSGKLDIHGAGTTTGINTQWADSTGAAKVSILDNGNVGIGTTNPVVKLQVNGSVIFSGTSTAGIDGELAYNTAGHYYQYYNGTSWLQLAGGSISYSGSLWTQYGNALSYTAGYVGIGTTSPASSLEVTGSVATGLGTAGAPGYTFAGDLNTGMWSPTTDTLAFSTAGAERMRILSSGNVGIGTTSPTYGLQVENSGSSLLKLKNTTTGGTSTFTMGDSLTVSSSGSTVYAVGAGNSFNVDDSGGTRLFKVVLDGPSYINAGNVGIGTTSPDNILSVQKASTYSPGKVDFSVSLNATSTQRLLFREPASNGITYFNGEIAYVPTTGGDANKRDFRFSFKDYGTFSDLPDNEVMRIRGDGNVGIGTTNPTMPLEIGGLGTQGSIQFQGSSIRVGAHDGIGYNRIFSEGTNMYYESGNDNYFRYQGTNVMTIKSGGNVGIGTTAPTKKLDVAGDINLTGGLYVSGVLQSLTANNWTTSGSDVYRASGNVGIGTTNPLTPLQINNTNATTWAANTSPMLAQFNNQSATTNTTSLLGFGVVGTDGNFAGVKIGAVSVNSYSADFVIANRYGGTYQENLRVMANGNVGIGTTNPSYALSVNGSNATNAIEIIGQAQRIQFTDINGGQQSSFIGHDNGRISFYNSAERLVIENSGNITMANSGGNVGIGTTNPNRAMLQVNGTTQLGPGTSMSGIANLFNNFNSYVGLALRKGGADTTNDYFQIQNSGGTNLYKISGTGGIALGSTFTSTDPGAGNMIISGNVGIGTTSPNQKLEVNGRIRMNTWTADGNTAVYYNSATGDIGVNVSDVRLKKNIQAIPNPLAIIQGITGVTYNMKTDPGDAQKTVGVIAQDVAAVMPELTFPITGPDGEEYLSVHYDKLAPVLIEGIKQQQTQIADVNLKTSQNVETVGQLQKSVDDNLTVISSNFSAVDTKLALHDSAMANVNSQIADIGAQVSNINSRLVSLDTQTSAIVSQVSALSGNMSLNEAEKSDLVSRLAAAETKLQTDEKNLTDFKKGVNDTISEMTALETTLTDMAFDHEKRIKALEDKIATLSVSAGGAAVTIPADAITQDASGNAVLAGIFEAKSVVAGAFSVKNEKDSGAPTMGDSEIVSVKVDADQDGWDDVTKVDGKSVRVKTGAVSETAKIFVSFENDPGARYWVEKIRDADNKLTDSFSINVSDPVKKDTKFSWWIVEEK